MISVYIADVGQGNMAIVVFPDNYVLVYDCNITNENEASVFAFLYSFMPKNYIDLFVNSHRDADHMRGIRKLNAIYPIHHLWDSNVSANTGTHEYEQYMQLRRSVPNEVVASGNFLIPHPEVRVLNGARPILNEPNQQSIVLHIDYLGSQILLTGDTDAHAWASYIVPEHGNAIRSLVLFASHHGSHTFFNPDSARFQDYTRHIESIQPSITVISVSSTNPHGHPHPQSLHHYNAHCLGADNGAKIFRTDHHGNMKIDLLGGGRGHIKWQQ